MTTPYKTTDDELAFLMERALKADEAEIQTGAGAISEGLHALDKAAGILEHLGDKQAAEAVTIIIEKMAGAK